MKSSRDSSNFLPTSKKEMDALGWDKADIILFTGDAYVDHPSFGAAVIGRILEKEGYKVAVVPQPNWRDDLRDFKKLGTPRLFFAVTSGSMDSMVNHYTANKRLRSNDAYTPNGKSGYRPDYAVKTYSKILKQLFPEVPLVLGGVEASLRRFTHYDYWANKLFPSILVESGADILVYGMGEKAIIEVAHRISKGQYIKEINDIPQTAFVDTYNYSYDSELVKLNSLDQCVKDKVMFGENFRKIEEESNKINAKRIVEPYKDQYVIVNPPFPPSTETEMDSWWNLPFTRMPHPRYQGKEIPAWEMIKFSINIHRGCFGGCSFCTISAHQGKFVASRSENSILNEIEQVKKMPDFKGYLSDLGGPSANMYKMKGKDISICKKCKKPSCIFPKICSNLNTNHKDLLDLYRLVNNIPGIKKAFVGSGVRYDLFGDFSNKTNREYFEELVVNHISGRLKVAPEHTEDEVLKEMRKPTFQLFKILKQRFDSINRKHSLNQQLIPYFISSHPGCKLHHMQNLAKEMRNIGINPEQVQDFTPTPMTLASTIFYTGVNPYTAKSVYVAKSKEEKIKQKSYFFGKDNINNRLQGNKGSR